MDVRFFNRQRSVLIPVARLRAVATDASASCVPFPGSMPSVLQQLAGVEVSVVSDRTIARLHRQFLGVPGPTDVITFPHGEIFVSASTAERQAGEHGESSARELARYIVHGFLHLHGHIDTEADDATRMWEAQERILGALWPPGS